MINKKKIILSVLLLIVAFILAVVPNHYYKYYFIIKNYEKANTILNISMVTGVIADIIVCYIVVLIVQNIKEFKEYNNEKNEREAKIYEKFAKFNELTIFNEGIDFSILHKCIAYPSIKNDIKFIENVISYDIDGLISKKLIDLIKCFSNLENISQNYKNEFSSGIDDLINIYFPKYVLNVIDYLNGKKYRHVDINEYMHDDVISDTETLINMINEIIIEINDNEKINSSLNSKAFNEVAKINGYKTSSKKIKETIV